MDWRFKAILQGVFSRVPAGHRLNHWFQVHVTRGLPISDARFIEVVGSAASHLARIRDHLPRPLAALTFYEFGAGYDLAVPLALYAFGVERQVLVDIRMLLVREVVEETLRRFATVALPSPLPRRPRPLGAGGLLGELRANHGLDYRAPCDARATGLPTGSVDVITSTNTLEHIPPDDIRGILTECHRILRDDGVVSFQIDYEDHYAYFDAAISGYNFLRFSDRAWRAWNPDLHYQNRLRHRDHAALIEAAGFEIIDVERRAGSPAAREALRTLPLDRRFAGYTEDELAVLSASFLIRKRR
jgi:SAM-dependent methyltransferase